MTKLDATALNDLRSCPEYYRLRHALGIVRAQRERGPLEAGAAIHDGLKVWFNDPILNELQGGSLELAKEAILASWGKDPLFPAKPLKYTEGFLCAVMEGYAERWPRQKDGFTVLQNEQYVEHPTIPWCGIVDRVIEFPDGSVFVMDTKAQPLSAKILTPDGWKLMGQISVGDEVIGSDGRPTKVLGVFPQGFKTTYRIRFVDGGECECSGDHLWEIWTSDNRKKILTTEQIGKLLLDTTYRLKVPLPDTIEMGKKDLSIDPYLMGVLLGDGYLAGNSVAFSTADEELVDYVREAIPKQLVVKKSKGKNYTHNIVSRETKDRMKNPLINALRLFGLKGTKCHTKFIPEPYLLSNASDRLALLQGLMDTDGTVNCGHAVFDNSNEIIIHDVVEIVRSLGGTARYRRSATAGDNGRKNDMYRVSLRLPEGMTPFRLSRKVAKLTSPTRAMSRYIKSVERIEIDQNMQCIKVEAEDGLYITDDYIVTHNTTSGYLRSSTIEEYGLSTQMRGYVKMRRDAGLRCDGVYLDIIKLDTRYHKVKPDNYLRAQVRYNDEQLDDWERDVASDAAHIEALKAERPEGRWPQYDKNCFRWGRPCPYWQRCTAPVDDPPEDLYTVERWEPSER